MTLVPSWFYKLSPEITVIIFLFVALHLVALVGLAIFYNTRKDSPDFKAKLK